MRIYAALDLLEGQCVRLKKGNFDEKTIYFEDPLEVFQWLEGKGYQELHLVDLSGAKNPDQRQFSLIRNLIAKSKLNIQYGGGLRTLFDIQESLETGVERVVLGSIALKDPNLFSSCLREFGTNRITLALDIKATADGSSFIALEGWTQLSDQNLFDWIDRYRDLGLNQILCTDIDRDGMLSGPNLNLYEKLVQKFPEINFQASGGISEMSDIHALSKIGIHSAVIGRALYEGRISLAEARPLC